MINRHNNISNFFFFQRLASLGHTVIGVEFVESAIEQFFQEQNIKFSVKTVEDFKVFTVKKVFFLDFGYDLLFNFFKFIE